MRNQDDKAIRAAEEIGLRLRALREEAGLTASQVGERVGVSGEAVRTWETGRHEPTALRLLALADCFACTVEHILGRPGVRGGLYVLDAALLDDQLSSTDRRDACWRRGKPAFPLDRYLRIIGDAERIEIFRKLDLLEHALAVRAGLTS